MQTPRNSSASANAINGLWTIALASFVVSSLYLAREILIPLTLSALLTFLLAPLVTRLERWVGRIAAVLVVVVMVFAGIGGIGWMLTRQLVDLARMTPDYKVNIQTKLRSFHTDKGGIFSKFYDTVNELKKDLPGSGPTEIVEQPKKPETAITRPSGPEPEGRTQIVETTKANPMNLVQVLIAPVLGPIGDGALVSLLVICMLLQREDLSGRLIRLIGQGRISATTIAMGDAGARVSKYLLMQLIVNVTYGVPVALGLYFIGVPNAMVWGILAAVLRFIPYVGPWIAAAIPILLSLAVSTSWTMPALTVGLFVVLELLSNNVMEPWLYGSRTGVSPIALILAAIFWTWLWGPMGLVLATPLTVCLVVLGRHVPRLSFLSVVLGDEKALTPAEDCYHRLLTVGEQDELELIEGYLKKNSLTELYDNMLIPAIAAAETDCRLEVLDEDQRMQIEQSVRDIIDDLGTRPGTETKKGGKTESVEEMLASSTAKVHILPVRAERDFTVGTMLMQLLQRRGMTVENASAKLTSGELLDAVEKAQVDAVCLSVVYPSTVIHTRYLCVKLRQRFPDLKILVGLWGMTDRLSDATVRLRESGANFVATTLQDTVSQLVSMVPAETAVPSIVSANGTAPVGVSPQPRRYPSRRDAIVKP